MARTFEDVAGFVGVPVESLRSLNIEQRAYLIETLIEVDDPNLGRPVPLVPNVMQSEILRTLDPYEITVKWRRAGLTSIYVASAWVNILTRPSWAVELFAHDWDTAKAIFERIVIRQWQRLPDAIRPMPSSQGNGWIKFDSLGSSFRVNTAGQSENVAMKKGQARTINELICTEFAFYAYPEDFIAKVENCVPRADGVVHIDSTPNGRNAFFRRYERAMQGQGRFRARFFPWWWGDSCWYALDEDESVDDLLGMGPITAEEDRLGEGNPYWTKHRGRDKLTPEQIKWRRWKIADIAPLGALTPEERFRVEYPEDPHSCFLASGRPVLPASDLVPRCKLREAIPGHWHVIGHDASTGDSSGHPCGISIIDMSTDPPEQVYEERAWIPVEGQAARLAALQKRYPGRIVPERNGPGLAVITALKAMGVKDIYRHRRKELRDGPKRIAERKPGFPMTSTTKPLCFEELRDAISTWQGREPELLLGGPLTLNELAQFQYDDNDLIVFEEQQLDDGTKIHGDVGIATAIAWQARKRTRSGIG